MTLPNWASQVGVVLGELAGSAGVGGGERYIELLLSRVGRASFHPRLICPEPGPFVERMTQHGIPTSVVNLTPLGNPWPLLRLAARLKREAIQVLQTHGARATFYGVVAGRLAGVPIIVATLHNWIREYDVSAVRGRLYERLLGWALRRTDRVICVSDALQRHAVQDLGLPPDRCVVVQNGIDLQQVRPRRPAAAVRADLHVGDGPMLVSVGRLTEQKGHRYLIEALPDLVKEWPGLRCVIVGEGESGAELTTLAASRGVAPACVFTGTRHDVPDLMAAADIVVQPSVSEGLPFAVLEAFALARPVAATRIEGMTELIEEGKTGRLVSPRNARALSAVLREMLRDSIGCQRMGEAGRAEVERRWTIDHLVEQTLWVFHAAWREKFGEELPAWVQR